MNLKISLICFVGLITAWAMPARAESGDLFLYPTPPDSMQTLQSRCNYIVSRFWNRCNFEQALRNPEKFNRAFGDWISIMQHADLDTAMTAIDALNARFVKKGPEALAIANLAEAWLYSDTTEMFSEKIYLPFARAAASHKKISKAEKARFQLHKQIIESSGMGTTVPNLSFIRPDGSKGHLDEANRGSVLIFINDPSCDDCNFARVRLSADYNTNELIRRGELTIVSILPEEPNQEWREQAQRYPETWIVGAMPDADTYFDLRYSPTFIFLNSRHKVLVKDIDLDYLLAAFRVANTASQQAQ